MLNKFFDPSDPVLLPEDIVTAFTKRKRVELILPARAVIVFNQTDRKLLCRKMSGRLIETWSPYRSIYRLGETGTVVARSGFGGSNTASLVEELNAFGVREFLLWGYCGGIGEGVKIGDILLAKAAIREDGASYHYLDDESDVVGSVWSEFEEKAARRGIGKGLVWTTDALYRETVRKVAYYRDRGVTAVEMEAASLYAVCRFLRVKGIAFLVVSDLLTNEGWQAGFFQHDFKEGVRSLSRFICAECVV